VKKAVVDSRLRSRCTVHDEKLLVFIVKQNVLGIDACPEFLREKNSYKTAGHVYFDYILAS